MNNLLFTALLIALLYYFFYYLPSQKKLNAQSLPLPHHQETQTEPIIAETKSSPDDLRELEDLKKDLHQKERTIIGLNDSYHKLEQKKNQQITELQEQIKTITHQLTELSTHHTKDEQDLTKTLDELLKGIQDLNNELD